MPFMGSPSSESTPDFSGAVSLKSIISADRLWLSYTIMKPPPPIPVECMLMTPTQSVVATAASTADPPFFRIFLPTLEHSALSEATAACRYANCFVGTLTFVGLLSKWLTVIESLGNWKSFTKKEVCPLLERQMYCTVECPVSCIMFSCSDAMHCLPLRNYLFHSTKKTPDVCRVWNKGIDD